MTTAPLLDLLADATHASSRVRFFAALDQPSEPLSQIWASSERVAGWLHARWGRDAVIATTLQASHDSLAGLIGAWRCGARVVSLPARARGQDIDAYRTQIQRAMALAGAQVLTVAEPHRDEHRELPVPVVALAEMQGGQPLAGSEGGGDLVQFSSGTTADPKGIVLSQEAIAANVAGILDRLDLEGPGISCSWLPLSHDMGLIGMCLVPWAAFGPRWQREGEMTLIPTETFVRNPAIWMRACSQFQATVTTAPTFAYQLVARRLRPDRPLDLSNLRACIVGAEPIPTDALEAFTSAAEPHGLDARSLCPAYGLAEASLAVSLHAPGTPWHAATPPGSASHAPPLVSCGEPLDGMQVRVASPDGPVGQLEITGPSLFEGYLAQPPRQRGGWHATGDLGTIIDGEVFVAGRAGDLLFVGGEKLGAVEVERAAQRARGTRADGTAAIQADSDRYLIVVERRVGSSARSSATDLGHDVRAEVVAMFGRGPAEVVVVPPGSLPRTPSGKIQRHRVRELLHGEALTPDARVVFKASRQDANTDV